MRRAGFPSFNVYFSFFDFLFFGGSYMLVRCPQRNYTSCKLGIGHIDKVFIIITIISRIQHPLIVRRGKLVLQCKIFALRHPNNCVFFSVCEFYAFTLRFTV